jgi:hypothetical protein
MFKYKVIINNIKANNSNNTIKTFSTIKMIKLNKNI